MAGRPLRRARRERQARARQNGPWDDFLRDRWYDDMKKADAQAEAERAKKTIDPNDFRSRMEWKRWIGGWHGKVPIGKYTLSLQAGPSYLSTPRAWRDNPLHYTAWEVRFLGPGGIQLDPRTVNDSCVNQFIRDARVLRSSGAYVETAVIQAFLDAVNSGQCVDEDYFGPAWGEYEDDDDDEEEEFDYDWLAEQASRDAAERRAAQKDLPLGKFLSACDRVRGGSTPHERNAARKIVLQMIEKYPGIEDAASTWAKSQKRPGCRVQGKAGSGPEPVREAPKDGPYSGPARVERGGKVAVIIAPGWGCGWSTWNGDISEDIMLFHPLLVELIESDRVNKGTVEAVFARLGLPPPSFSYDGNRDLDLSWVPKGALFQIREQDGSEHVEIFHEDNWTKANPQSKPRRPRRKRRR
jgi:hypothetical protein